MKASLRNDSRPGVCGSYSLGLDDSYAVPARLDDSSQPYVEADTTPLITLWDRRLVGFDSDDPELDGTAKWNWVKVIDSQRAVTWAQRVLASNRSSYAKVTFDVTFEYPTDAPDLTDEFVVETDAGDKFRCQTMGRYPTYVKAELIRLEGGA